ncbi:recombinase family protein [Flavilitoribacter nigricans]|uniref:Resolvase n=1 Tax=Flavilitoribacter nigricans (strain ATCC 23147 / DSM 23189 / NBRC 102662 / NCIMB 1420 / SS-2) TaxID=1122177 RepID=A0A2D0NF92_FLAN2|nr:recombinase family protein [Flavilitoribacter nigricans]PHN06839.1 resolvase [Flavilitoribacter nigricans DSM 23189 = NBRC 102662]
MKVGYARVSTGEQHLEQQIEALKAAGCEEIFQEKVSGVKSKRPQLEALKRHIRRGDKVYVWKLDRLGRSIIELTTIVTEWRKKGIDFYSVSDNTQFDDTAGGKLFFHMMAAFAEFERNLISERTKAGLQRAKKQGRVGGRPKGLSKKSKQKAVVTAGLYLNSNMSITEISEHLEIARSTIYRYLDHMEVDYEKRSKKREKKPQKQTN